MTNEEALAALAGIRTPIVYDAVEKYELQPRTDGLMDTSIRSLLPGLGPMVGYATTGKIAGEYPAAGGDRSIEWEDLWSYVQQAPGPNVMVVQDLDQPPGKCCAWGDIAASIFLRLGAVGAVTNGGVRDLPEVEALGFQLFASSPVVGHGYTHWVEMNTPVKIGSLMVYPGDLLHGDEHGVMVIPGEIELPELVTFIAKFLASEKTVIDYCKGPDFEVDQVMELMRQHAERTERR